jgi:hypothetical protein
LPRNLTIILPSQSHFYKHSLLALFSWCPSTAPTDGARSASRTGETRGPIVCKPRRSFKIVVSFVRSLKPSSTGIAVLRRDLLVHQPGRCLRLPRTAFDGNPRPLASSTPAAAGPYLLIRTTSPPLCDITASFLLLPELEVCDKRRGCNGCHTDLPTSRQRHCDSTKTATFHIWWITANMLTTRHRVLYHLNSRWIYGKIVSDSSRKIK